MARSDKKKLVENGDMGELDFESQFDKLNACVADLESGRMSLDDSLKAYRDGIDLVSRCRAILEKAQARVESIESVEDSGAIGTTPLDLETERHEALRSAEPNTASGDEPF